MLRDLDIRRALHLQLLEDHGPSPATLLVDELGLSQGASRVDVAAINGALHGYEIKSDVDRLDRLGRQRDHYGEVFDTVTLVTVERHLAAARPLIPRWWGLSVASAREGVVVVRRVRTAKANRRVRGESVARLLWRSEALQVLELHGLADGLRSKPRAHLWRALAEELDGEVLGRSVREALRARSSWRPPAVA